MNWDTKVLIPEDAEPGVYRAYLEMIMVLAKLSRVPRNATWRAYTKGTTSKGRVHFLIAEWAMRDALYD